MAFEHAPISAVVRELRRQHQQHVQNAAGKTVGYFVCSSGIVTDEVIAQYIELQDAEPEDDDRFRVSE